MAANYVIVANFCDWVGPFLKFQKKNHIADENIGFGSVPP